MDKRTTAAAVVAELRDGMTLGIGGWGSRRKPMALVREILRSPVKDLTVVSYGGPDVGLLCAAGKVRKLVYGFVSLDSIPLEPHFRKARRSGLLRSRRVGRGHVAVGSLRRRAATAVPADARGPRLRRDDDQSEAAHGALALRRRRGARRGAGAPPRRRDRPHEPRRRARQRPVPRPRPVLRRPLLHGREAPLHDLRAARRDARLREVRLGAHAEDQPHDGRRRRRDADGRALHRMPAGLRSRRGVPARVRRDREESRSVGGVPQALPRSRERGGVPEGRARLEQRSERGNAGRRSAPSRSPTRSAATARSSRRASARSRRSARASRSCRSRRICCSPTASRICSKTCSRCRGRRRAIR